MKLVIKIWVAVLFIASCKKETVQPDKWRIKEVVILNNIHPIGIAADGNDFFISDGDHNRVVKTDREGEVLIEYPNLERPMHLDFGQVPSNLGEKSFNIATDRTLLVPEYGKDSIAIIKDNDRSYLPSLPNLDAPAAVSVSEKFIAIADFYNHQIVFYDGDQWKRIGKEGHILGELYYPTDVQIFNDTLYVADAYNHRGQVFSLDGKVIRSFGETEGFNAATGILVTKNNIYLTDFENNRVLSYDRSFNLVQELSISIDKPTDVLKNNDQLIITNYKRGELVIFQPELDSQ
ncbi:NHL repeat-containing protein [Aquimarina sp. ERC-38]|uniref:NHL repeat-containing protein n=1 Tax=Aquimarina sp. ERC-38 TaxID=2949996 RepID=UPI002247C2E5|nr:NHL repeat-containing protein [Aquimarina sp. ERC-38]UZO80859.1 NHL repeat-containing protein [Aquimarina sp. ERC-38]